MSKKILLVGCGQLGSRHLQAVAAAKGAGDVWVVDQKQEGLVLGQERLKQVEGLNANINFHWTRRLEEVIPGGDICIVASLAKGRCGLIKEISEKLGYKNFIIEKVVSQSAAEYKDLSEFCKERGINVWVNCKTRAYQIHQYIKTRIPRGTPFLFTAAGGDMGLANMGIHMTDLFVYYDEAKVLTLMSANPDIVLHPSKRGNDLYDLSGTLSGKSEKGSQFILSFANENPNPEMISVFTKESRFIIDHVQQFAYESYAQENWAWKHIPVQENWLVSYMTKGFVEEILEKGTCALPTLEECSPAHQFILNALQPAFRALLNENIDHCPVT